MPHMWNDLGSDDPLDLCTYFWAQGILSQTSVAYGSHVHICIAYEPSYLVNPGET